MKHDHYDLLIELLQEEISRLKKEKFSYWQEREKLRKENRRLQREIANFATETGGNIEENS